MTPRKAVLHSQRISGASPLSHRLCLSRARGRQGCTRQQQPDCLTHWITLVSPDAHTPLRRRRRRHRRYACLSLHFMPHARRSLDLIRLLCRSFFSLPHLASRYHVITLLAICTQRESGGMPADAMDAAAAWRPFSFHIPSLSRSQPDSGLLS